MEKTARQGKLDGAWELYATLEDDLAGLLPALEAASDRKVRKRTKTGKSRAGKKGRLPHTSRRKR
jgi:hypothetical protein